MKIRHIAAAVLTAAFTIGTAAAASATVNPVVIRNNNAAGAFAAPSPFRQANGDRIDGVKASFYLRSSARFNTGNHSLWNPSTDPAAPTAKGGALLGVELCNALSLTSATEVAVLFVQYNSASNLFDVFIGHSASTNCLGAMGGVTSVTQVDAFEPGHQVFLAITQGPGGTIHFTDADLTNDTGAHTTFGGFTGIDGFNRAGIGTNAGIDALNAPPTVRLARFTGDAVRDTDVGWANVGNPALLRIRTRLVEQATTFSDVFVSPTISPTQLVLDRGTLNSP